MYFLNFDDYKNVGFNFLKKWCIYFFYKVDEVFYFYYLLGLN